MEDSKINFIAKVICIYVIEILCGIVEGGIRLNLFGNLFSMIGGISCAALYTHLVMNVIAAGVWHLLEKAEEKHDIKLRIRNIFLGMFYSGISMLLVYIEFSGKNYFESFEDVIIFYSVMIFETIIIAILIPYVNKLFNNKSFLNLFLKGLNICFNFFLYWFLIVIVFTWLPFDLNSFMFKLITYPVFAICVPIRYFVGSTLDIVATMLVMYMIKIFLENEIKAILKRINEDCA